MNVLHQVVKAEPVDDRHVRVSFENGAVGIFDCSPYFKDDYWGLCAILRFLGRCEQNAVHFVGRMILT